MDDPSILGKLNQIRSDAVSFFEHAATILKVNGSWEEGDDPFGYTYSNKDLWVCFGLAFDPTIGAEG